MNRNNPVTIVYCVLLASGAAIVLPHPTWTGLAALLLFLPGIAINGGWLGLVQIVRGEMESRLVDACERPDRRGGATMPTPRKPTHPTTEAIDQFCARFDDLLARYEERTALRQYLIGLLLPREHNKTLVELGAIVPGPDRQRLHHFLHDAPCGA